MGKSSIGTRLSDSFNEIVEKRRAVCIFSQDAEFDESSVERSLRRALLAPTSNNMQLWEAYRVNAPQKLKEVATLCLEQKPATTARELIVFVCRYDLWKKRVKFNYEQILKYDPDNKEEQTYYKKTVPLVYSQDCLGIWGVIKKSIQYIVSFFTPSYMDISKKDIEVCLHKSCALVAQTFMLSMTSEGYATCPLEGFDSRRLKRYLKLPGKAQISLVVAAGPEASNGVTTPRIRVPFEEVYKKL